MVLLGAILTVQLLATVLLLWKDYRPNGLGDFVGMVCTSLNFVLIGALMWKAIP